MFEEFWCNYGVERDFEPSLSRAGLIVSGVGEQGEPRIVELEGHPFFVATLFLPQKRSLPDSPHPLLIGFERAVRVNAA